MSIVELETDYLVVGTGAMGMAFTDEILTRTDHDRVIILDRNAKPGGHWNAAYDFVSLHQPAAYYGVNSEKLGTGGAALASGKEVLAYYERVMRKLLDGGRLQHFPMCEYRGNGRFTSLESPETEYQVQVRKKTVDATYMKVEVPSTRPPEYEVTDGVTLVPLNELVKLHSPQSKYVIIGAGKTGMDAILFLLDQGVQSDDITWIISSDAWFLNRADLNPNRIADDLPTQLRCILQANSIDDYLKLQEAQGRLLRLDETIWPSKYRCATVSLEELEKLRSISKVVRMGKVLRIDPAAIVLEQGEFATHNETIHVDCTANGLQKMPARPVFDGDTITLQALFICQQVFSASVIAYLECLWDDDARKNAIASPVPHPEVPRDFIYGLDISIKHMERWSRIMPWWIRRSRLCMTHHFTFFRLIRHAIKVHKLLPQIPPKVAQLLES